MESLMENESVKALVNPDNLVLAVEKLKSFLFTEQCYDTFFNKKDFTDEVCLKAFVSKGLSVGIIAGSFLLKVPQMLKISLNGNAQGISSLSYFLELLNYTICVTHHLRHNNPVIAWFETLNLLFQDVILLLMIFYFNGSYGMGALSTALYAMVVFALKDESIVTAEILEWVVGGSIFMVIASRLPQ
eukprot:Ihof_evm9s90 gene=Ihof_evmTU9s90